ncbi:MAG: hypothetical protein AAB634_02680 [Patescibacteria group bacterium]
MKGGKVSAQRKEREIRKRTRRREEVQECVVRAISTLPAESVRPRQSIWSILFDVVIISGMIAVLNPFALVVNKRTRTFLFIALLLFQSALTLGEMAVLYLAADGMMSLINGIEFVKKALEKEEKDGSSVLTYG